MPTLGMNRACTFVNVSPWIASDSAEQAAFNTFPWYLLRGDYVGFTAITDPLWPALDRWLWSWIENAAPVAKLLTCVSKWPVSRATLRRLARVPNFHLVVTITGMDSPIERVSVGKHLETLRMAREEGVAALPIIHPYISGLSDLSFLSELPRLGYSEIDVKGFRYCAAQMSSWMPPASQALYAGHESEEVLPEDGWRERVHDAGLTLLSPRQWYLRSGSGLSPHVERQDAEAMVRACADMANIVTSTDTAAVISAAVARRM